MIDYVWTRYAGNGSKLLALKTLAEAVAIAESVVAASFEPTAEHTPSAVRIVRISRILRDVIQTSPEVEVTPFYGEILVDGGNPDFSPAGSSPDPIPFGEQGWLCITYPSGGYRPAELVHQASCRLLDRGVHAARIRRGLSAAAETVWESKKPV
jgi:hypothetical protein